MPDKGQSTPEPITGALSVGRIRAIVLSYAAFAGLWILFSDMGVAWLVSDPARASLAGTLKGVFFVLVTALLLWGLLRRLVGPAAGAPAMAVAADLRRPILPLTLLIAAILALSAGGMAYTLIHQRDKGAARLQAIADLRASQVSDWLKERQGGAQFVATSRFFADQYRHWRQDGDGAGLAVLQARLEQLRHYLGFSAVSLLDPQGALVWGGPRAPAELAEPLRDAAQAAARDGQVHRVGPYRGRAGTLRLDFVCPLTVGGAPIPLIVLHTDPTAWLNPTLLAWPVPSASGETLLVRRDGDQVLFLSDLRHRPDMAAKLRLPLATPTSPAAQVLRGAAPPGTLMEGQDYRGEPVLAMAQAISGTDWFLIAKLDRSELYADAYRDATWLGLTGLLALFMAVAGLTLLRQRQQLALAAGVQQAQAERLRALDLLAAITDSSDDAIYAKDLEGRYTLFNRAACGIVGEPATEVLGRDDRAIFPAEQAEILMAVGRQVIAEDRAIALEVRLNTPGGERSFLDTRGPLRDAQGHVIGTFGIARDITERKAAEEALRRQTAELAGRNAELERFNRAMVGRELDMIALKREINALSVQIGREPPYPLGFLDDAATQVDTDALIGGVRP